jgi:hypothetical protein
MNTTILKSLMIVLILFATPAVADDKILLSCTNGRSLIEGAPYPLDPNWTLEIDLQARTVNGVPITQLSDTQIVATTGRIQLERDIEGNTTWFIDRVGGHLRIMSTVKPVTCQKMSCANVWDMVYDCASTMPKF